MESVLMKKMIISTFCLTLSFITLASGERSIFIDIDSIKRFGEIELSELIGKRKYLGSTQEWIFVGETLTSTDGDMPYSNSYGYKIKKHNVKVINGWDLNVKAFNYLLYVSDCPVVTYNEKDSTLMVEGDKGRESNCIIDTIKLTKQN